MRSDRLRMVRLLVAGSLCCTSVVAIGACATSAGQEVPRFSHVVEVVLENETATTTFENPTAAPNLAKLRAQGVYVPGFFGVGHSSLDNYEAMIASVTPTAAGENDCEPPTYTYGQCIFPASIRTVADLFDARDIPWKIYMEGMAGAPLGGPCLHMPDRALPDLYQGGTLGNGYADRHNPAVWFDSILARGSGEDYCRAHDVDLNQFWADASSAAGLPAWSLVVPDTCHDGHDNPGIVGCTLQPEDWTAVSGVPVIDGWLPGFVSRLTSSKSWDARSLLVIAFDEGDGADTAGCTPCNDGSAGGRTGLLLIGDPLKQPGITDTAWQGDHYSLLRTWEVAWGLPTLKSDAADPNVVNDGDPGVQPLTGIWK